MQLPVVDMVFSSDDKAVIKNDFEEKGWTAYRIWKEHPTRGWILRSVQRLVNRFKVTGTMSKNKDLEDLSRRQLK